MVLVVVLIHGINGGINVGGKERFHCRISNIHSRETDQSRKKLQSQE